MGVELAVAEPPHVSSQRYHEEDDIVWVYCSFVAKPIFVHETPSAERCHCNVVPHEITWPDNPSVRELPGHNAVDDAIVLPAVGTPEHAGVTLKVAVPKQPDVPEVKLIVAVPNPVPVTVPADTVPTAGSLLVHVPLLPLYAATVPPTQTDDEIVTVGFALTKMLALFWHPLAAVYIIVA